MFDDLLILLKFHYHSYNIMQHCYKNYKNQQHIVDNIINSWHNKRPPIVTVTLKGVRGMLYSASKNGIISCIVDEEYKG